MTHHTSGEELSARSRFARTIAFALTVAIVIAGNPLIHNADASSGPIPSVSIGFIDPQGHATATGLIGEDAHFQATFDNVSATLSDVGYGPYIDVVLPTSGADGVALAPGADGISFVNAKYLGIALTPQILTCPVGGVFGAHPVTGSTGPSCTQGDTMIVIAFPIGSYAPGNPPLVADITLHTSSNADVGTALNVQARSGFQFGASPTGSPITNNTLAGQAFTPELYLIRKNYNGPEHETATGPNFTRSYTVTADIATGQTLTNFTLRDQLPAGFAYVNPAAPATVPAGASITLEPNKATASTEPGSTSNAISATDNLLEALWSSVTGSASTSDATMTFSYFMPKSYNADQSGIGGTTIINPTSGDDVALQDTATSQGTWVPTDPRDTPHAVNAGPANDTMTAKSIAVQKSATIATDNGATGATPDDILLYTVDVQVSDYFNFNNVVLNSDVLGDGQTMLTETDASQYRPTISVSEGGSSHSGAFAKGSTYSVDTSRRSSQSGSCANGSGSTLGASIIDFNLSGAMTAASPGLGLGDGILTGDLVKDTSLSSGTTVQIKFWARIDDSFDCQPGNTYVDQTDHVKNDITVTGDLLNSSDSPLGTIEADTSSARVDIANGSLTKTVYARNGIVGSFPTGSPFSPGDTITYRIKYTNALSDMENFSLNDYLPLPVLLSPELISTDPTHPVDDPGTYNANAPAAGTMKYGPSDTYGSDAFWGRAGSHTFPTLTTTAANNNFKLDFGTFNSTSNVSTVTDIMYTVTLTDSIFNPGLSLTNLVRASFNNTFLEATNTDALEFVELALPNLGITKGVVATNQVANAHTVAPTYSPALGNGPWSVPGSSGTRFSGTINSNNLNINSNVSGVDSGDLVTFAIAIQNTGDGRKGAYDVNFNDTLPAGFQVPSGGLNLTVTDGTGATISTTTHGTGLFDPAGGIELNDPGPTPAALDNTNGGAIDAASPTSGRNIAIITYDLEAINTVESGSTLTNVATITQYHGTEGGGSVNYAATPAACGTPPCYTYPNDNATAKVLDLSATKTIVGGDTTHTIGETYQYLATITVPEGLSSSLNLVDTLDSGLAFVSMDSISGSGITTDAAGGLNGALSNATYSTVGSSPLGDGRKVAINLGNVTNSNTDNSTPETITITYTVVVLNASINQQSQTRTNNISITSTNSSTSKSATPITIVEPTLTVVKTAVPVTGDAQDAVKYNIVITNTSAEPAYDATLSDVIPASTAFDASFGTGGFDLSSCAATPTTGPSQSAGTVAAAWSSIAAGASCTITVQVIVNVGVTPAQVIANTANINWTSLSGTVQNVSSHNTLSDERDGTGGVNDYAAASTANLTINSITATKGITATSEPTTSAVTNKVTIGEQITYQVVVTVPEGTSPNLKVVDTLPTSMALATSVAGVTISADSDLTLGNPTGNPTSNAVGGIIGRKLSLDFGTVVNNANNDGNAETITITYVAVVLDLGAVTRNATGQNSAVVSWGGTPGGSITVKAPIQTIVEPTLAIAKTTSAAGPFSAGSTFNYLLTINHTAASNSDAFDMTFTDSLPTEVSINGAITQSTGPTCSFSHDGATTGGVVSGTCAHFATTDASITLSVPVTVNVAAAAGSTVTNTGSIAWTSTANNLDGTGAGNAQGHERNGSGGTDNYAASDPASFVVVSPVVDKTMIATSEIDTTGTQVAVGEIVTYQLQVNIPQGHTDNVIIADTLSPGMAFVDVTSITKDTDLTLSGGTVGTPPTGFTTSFGAVGTGVVNQGRTMSLHLGNITNGAQDLNNEYVTIQYRTIVLNATANVRGHNINNAATIDWTNNPSPSPLPAASIPAAVTVVEPTLVIAKSATPTASDAGNTVTYTIRIDHSAISNADAHDVVFTDAIPAGMIFDGIGTVASTGGTNNVGVGTATFAGNTLTVPIGDIAEGGATDQYSEFTFTATIDTSAVAGSTITNTGRVAWQSISGAVSGVGTTNNALGVERTGDNSDPGDSNPHTTTDPASVTIGAPAVDKALTDPSDTTEAVGEVFQYDVTLTFPQGTTHSVTMSDTLDSGLAFVRLNGVIASTNELTSSNGAFSNLANFTPTVAPGGGSFSVNLGNIANANTDSSTAETIIVRYAVIVLNSSANQNAQFRNNLAHASYDPGTGTIALANVSAPNIEIVEPVLQMTKAASPTTADGGDQITYTITMNHTAASTSSAYDVAFTDQLPTGTTFVAGSVTAISGVAPGAGSVSGSTLTVPVGTISQGAQSTFSFKVLVGANAVIGSTIHNVGTTKWTSISGSGDAGGTQYNPLGVERTGDTTDPGTSQNVYATNASADVGTPTPSFTKALTAPAATSQAIGSVYQYDLKVTVPEGTTRAVHFTDTLDAGLAFVRVDQVIAPGSVTTNYTGGFPQAITDAQAGISNNGGTLSMALGDIANANSSNATPEVVIVRYSVIVLDALANQRAQTRTNSAAADYNNGTSTASLGSVTAPAVTLVEPTLHVAKSADVSHADAGDTVTYTVTLSHTGASNGTAFNATFQDVLPGFTTYVANSAAMTTGTAPDVAFSETAGTLTATWNAIPVGQTRTFTYQVTLDSNTPAGANLVNAARIDWDSVASVPADSNAHNSAGHVRNGTDGPSGALDDYAAIASAGIDVLTPPSAKGLSTTSVTGTTGTNVVAGEIATYYLHVQLPEGVSNSIAIVDTLPNGTSFIPGTVALTTTNDPLLLADFNGTIANPTVSTVGQALHLDWGNTTVVNDNVANNNYFVVRYQVRVGQGVSDGDTLTNGASISLDGGAALVLTPVSVHVIAPVIGISKEVSTDGITWASTLDTEPKATSPELYYRLVVSNTGTANAYDVNIVDNTPTTPVAPFTNLSVDAVSGATIVDGEVAIDADLEWMIASIPAGGSKTLTYHTDLVTSSNFSENNALTNTAHVPSYWSAPAAERDDDTKFTTYTADPSDSATVTLHFPQLTLTKTTGQTDGLGGYIDQPGAGLAQLGQPFPWRVTVANSSAFAAAHHVTAHDLLPPGWTYVAGSTTFSAGSASEPTVAGAPQNLDWTVDSAGHEIVIGAGSSLTIAFNAIPTMAAKAQTDPHVNTASATATDSSNSIGNHGGSYNPADDSAAAHLQLPNLHIVKTPDGDHVAAGSIATFSLAVRNDGDAAAHNTIVADVLPASVSYDAAHTTPTPVSVTPGPSGTTNVVWNLGTLGAHLSTVPLDHRMIVLGVTVHADATGDIDNTSNVRSDEYDPAGPPADTDTGQLVVDPNAPSFAAHSSKTSVPAPGSHVAVGDTITYTLHYQNDGPGDATNVVVSDLLPAPVSFTAGTASPASVNGHAVEFCVTCNGSDWTTSEPSGVRGVRWPIGTVAANTPAAAVSFATTVKSGLLSGTRIVNVGKLTSSETPDGITLGPVEHILTGDPHLTLVKTVDRNSINLDTETNAISYGMTLTNDGNALAHNTQIVDHVPGTTSLTVINNGGYTVDCSSNGGAGWGSCPTDLATVNALRWHVGDLGANVASSVVGFDVTVNLPATNGSTITNHGQVTSDETGIVDSNPVDTVVTAHPHLVIDKAVTPTGALKPGTTLTYTVTYSNTGTADAINVLVADPIPTHTAYVAGSATGSPTFVVGATSQATEPTDPTTVTALHWHHATLLRNAPATVTFQAKLDAAIDNATNITNVATITADNATPANDNANVSVNSAPKLELQKIASAPTVALNDVVTYTLTVSNIGNATAKQVDLTDPLPTGLQFVSASNGATLQGSSVAWPKFDLESGQSKAYMVTTRVVGTGHLTNVAVVKSVNGDGKPGGQPPVESGATVDGQPSNPLAFSGSNSVLLAWLALASLCLGAAFVSFARRPRILGRSAR